jgi:hypothetical protein
MNRPGHKTLLGLLILGFCFVLAIWGRPYLPYQLANPEYIIVRIKDRPAAQVSVLINGRKNGTTGQLITLGGSGQRFISVDFPNARQKSVDVENTTASHPLHVEIDCSPLSSPTPTPTRP